MPPGAVAPVTTPSPAPDPAPSPTSPTGVVPTTFTPAPAGLDDAVARLRAATQPNVAATSTPGGTMRIAATDHALLDPAFAQMRRSPTAARVLTQLERTNIQVKVLDDSSFDRIAQGGTAAMYDPPSDTLYMRSSWLQKSPEKSASLLAHEGQHALDDLSGIGQSTLQQRVTALAGSGPVTAEVVKQAGFEVQIAKEARGYVVQGQVLKELGLVDPAKVGGPLLTAAQGQDDKATYDAVYRGLVSSPEGGYNPEHRTAEPIVLS
jgi:hypothetical protein